MTIRRLRLVAFLGSLLLVAASVAVTFAALSEQRHDALVINLAGRQRMLSQQMALQALGVQIGADPAYRQALHTTAHDYFEKTLEALIAGGEAPYVDGATVTLPQAPNPEILAQLETVRATWVEMHAAIMSVLEEDPARPAFAGAVAAVERLSPTLLSQMDEAVRLYEAEAERKVTLAQDIQIGFLAMAAALLAAAFFLTERWVLSPIDQLGSAARRIGAGDLDTPVPAVRLGEINRLARSFDDMRQNLAATDLSAHLLDSMLDAVVVANPDGTVRMMNRAALELFGCTAAEVAGQPVGRFFAEEEEEEEEEVTFFRSTGLARLVREGAAREVETTLLTRAGERVPVVFNGSVVRDAGGGLVAVVGVARDMRPTRRLIREAEARAAESTVLKTIAEELNRRTEIKPLMDEVLPLLGKTLGASAAWVTVLDERGNFTLAGAHNLPPALEADDRAMMRWPQCLCQRQLLAGQLTEAVNILECDRLHLVRGLSGPAGDTHGLRYHASVPIRARGRALGLLNLTTAGDRVLGDDELRLLGAVGDQIGVALERAQLFAESQRSLQRLATLYTVGKAITARLELEKVCQAIVDEVAGTLRYGVVAVLLLDREAGELFEIAWHGAALQRPDSRLKPGEGLAGRAVLSGQAQITPDVTLEPAYVPGLPGCRSEADIPIKLGDVVTGVLVVEDVRENAYSQEDVSLLTAIADQAAIAIENARLYEQVKAHHIEEQATLLRLSQAMMGETEVQAVMDLAVRAAAEALKVEFVSIALLDAEGQTLSVEASLGWPTEIVGQLQQIPLASAPGFAYGLRTQAPVVIPDEAHETRFGALPWVAQIGIASSLLVPMFAAGKSIGGLLLNSRTPRDWSDDEVRLLSLIANDTALAFERARLWEHDRERLRILQGIHELAQAFAALRDIRETLRVITELAARLVNAESCVVTLFDPGKLEVRAAPPGFGVSEAQVTGFVYVADDEAVALWDTARDETFLENDPARLPPRFRALAEGLGARNVLAARMIAHQQSLGILYVANKVGARGFSADDAHLLATLANQAVVAIENAQLYAHARERLERITALHEIDVAITSRLDLGERLDVLLQKVAERLRVDAAAVAFVKPQTQELVYAARHGLDGEFFKDGRLKVKEGIAGQVAYSGELAAIPDVTAEPRFVRRAIAERLGIVSYLAVPLQVHGEVIGILELATRERHAFLPEEIDFFVTLAGQAAIAIENARLFEEANRRAARQSALAQTAGNILATLDESALSSAVTGAVRQTLAADRAAVYLYDPASDRLTCPYASGLSAEYVAEVNRRFLDLPGGRLLSDPRPFAIADAQTDPATAPFHDLMVREGFHSYAVFPLAAPGAPLGALVAYRDAIAPFSADDVATGQTLVHIVAVALQNARLFQAEREQRELAEALREIGSALTASLDFEAVLDRLLELIARVVPYDCANVMLVAERDGRIHVARTCGYEQFGEQVARDMAALSFEVAGTDNLRWMAETRQPLFIPDTAADPGWVKVEASAHVRSWAGAPLVVRDQVVAFFSLDKIEPNFYQPGHGQRLAAFAAQAALALQNARLFESLTSEKRRLELLYDLSQNLAAILDPRDVAVEALDLTTAALGVFKGEVLVCEPGSDRLRLVAVSGYEMESIEALDRWLDLRIGQGLAGYAALTRAPRIAPDVARDEHWISKPGVDDWVRSAAAIPLVAGDQLAGVLSLLSDREDFFRARDLPLLTAVAAPIALALQKALLFEAERVAREQAEMLREAARAVSSSLELDEVLRQILAQLKRVLDYNTASVLLLSETGQPALVTGSGYADEHHTSHSAGELLQNSPILNQMARDLQPVIIPDVREHPGWLWVPGAEHVRAFLAVPILSQGRMIGALMIDSIRPGFFAEADAHVTQTLAQHMAVAIENARLFEAERAQLLLARTLQEVGASLTSQLGLEELMERVLDLLGRVVQYDSISIQLIGEDGYVYLAAGRGFPDLEQARRATRDLTDHSMSRKWAVERNAIVIADTQADDNWLVAPGVEYIRSWIGAPLLVKDRLIGTLNVDSRTVNAFNAAIGQTVLVFANQAAIAIENARLFEAERDQARRLAAVAEVVRQAASLDLDELLHRTVDLVQQWFGYYYVNVLLVDPPAGEIVLRASASAAGGRRYEGYRLRIGEQGITGSVAASGQPLLVNDVEREPHYHFAPELAETRSELAVPILSAGQVVGVLDVQSDRTGAFATADRDMLLTLAAHLAVAIANAQSFEEATLRFNDMRVLREVGVIISASLDRHATLTAILDQAVVRLATDAADILLLQADDRTLEYSAGRGFRTEALQHTRLPLGEGYAGRAASERVVVHIPDLRVSAGDLPRAPLLTEEAFVTYYGVPLMAKGQITGVLELFHRSPFVIGPERLEFLQALGAQAAIAIENATLFDNLQRSHLALRDAQTRLVSAARLTAVGELAAGVAHQINNPLTTVIADAQLLLKSVGSDHPGYASAAAIFQAGWRAQRVVQRLLNFSRPDEGKYVATDVNETLVEALDLVGAHIGRGGADLKLQLAADLPLIPANGHQLEEVWINLLMNARDALVEGRSGVITLSSRLAADGAAVEVEVADNGRGISEADRRHLFTPFYTTKSEGRGNGLGLSVCQTIVQDHGGQIQFESQLGGGAAFFIRLPLKRESA